jgi:hypothetical protein
VGDSCVSADHSFRPTLAQIRRAILARLDDEWRTPSYFSDLFGLGHCDGWIRAALVLERLAHDDLAEIEIQGKRRRFRRKRNT